MRAFIVNTLYLLAVLIPLTFTTINHELFEFPKFILLLSATLVITVSWAIHIYQTRDFKIFTPSLLSYTVLAILITQVLATLFSLHPYTSFWGYYSRFHQGLLTTICYTILFFASLKWMDKDSTQKLIKIMIGTSIIVGLYAIAQRFGIDKNTWIQDVQNRPFSTLGQPNWLAAYLIPPIFLGIYFFQLKSKTSTFYSSLIFLILTTALLLTKSRSGFIGFGLSYLTYWMLMVHQLGFKAIQSILLRYTTLLILLFLVVGTPYTKPINFNKNSQLPTPTASTGTQLDTGGTESGDIRKIVWTGALDLIKAHPILGTGPETFAYTYYQTRPSTHNQTSEWDFLYNKAHNEYLNFAANSGLLGLLAYLAYHLAIAKLSLTKLPKSKKINQEHRLAQSLYYPVLGASLVGFTITNFFGFSVIPVYLYLTMLVPLSTTLKETQPPLGQDFDKLNPLALITPLLVLIYPLNLFLADLSYTRGKAYLDAGQSAKAISHLQTATSKRGGLDLYHATLGEAYASLGQKEYALQELKLNQQQNPHHLNFFKSRAKIYLTLASLDPKYNQLAADELEMARSLAKTDPKLAYNLGLVYTRLSQLDKAETHLRSALSLKPDYHEPYYALTLLYEQSKQADKIPAMLQDAKTNLATYSSLLKDKIELYAP